MALSPTSGKEYPPQASIHHHNLREESWGVGSPPLDSLRDLGRPGEWRDGATSVPHLRQAAAMGWVVCMTVMGGGPGACGTWRMLGARGKACFARGPLLTPPLPVARWAGRWVGSVDRRGKGLPSPAGGTACMRCPRPAPSLLPAQAPLQRPWPRQPRGEHRTRGGRCAAKPSRVQAPGDRWEGRGAASAPREAGFGAIWLFSFTFFWFCHSSNSEDEKSGKNVLKGSNFGPKKGKDL